MHNQEKKSSTQTSKTPNSYTSPICNVTFYNKNSKNIFFKSFKNTTCERISIIKP